jgi:hypothetical protein
MNVSRLHIFALCLLLAPLTISATLGPAMAQQSKTLTVSPSDVGVTLLRGAAVSLMVSGPIWVVTRRMRLTV